jgi:hypothetical protein
MAYTVKYQGYEVSCDTVDDLRALLNANGASQPKTATSATIQDSSVHGGKMLTGVSGLVAKLKKEQRDLLRHVATNGKVTRERLRQLVGVPDPHQFAGILISISKSAAGAGMKSPIETIDERENGNGPRAYQYKIRDEVKTEVKEALSTFQ